MAKAAGRSLRRGLVGALKPHQEERFVPYIMHAELAILQVATAEPALTDDGVRESIARLVRTLKHSAPLASELDAAAARAQIPSARDELGRRVLAGLAEALAESGPLLLDDVVGVLGTVKSSAGTWSQGPRSQAYLAYLREFFAGMGLVVVADEVAGPARSIPDGDAL
jgi:hypothetical protein